MTNFKILDFFKSTPFYSICNINIDLQSYHAKLSQFTEALMSHGNLKFNTSNINFAAYLYVYIAFTAILTSTASLNNLRMVSVPLKLPIFNILLLKNVSPNVNMFSRSTGNVFGFCTTSGIQEFVNHCLSLTESDLNNLVLSKYFGIILTSSGDKIKFLHYLKLIIKNCFVFDSNNLIVSIDYLKIANSLEFTSRVIDNWEVDNFIPDIGDSCHLNIHRFRGNNGQFICDFAGFSSLSSEKISSFVCFLSLFDVSFTSSSDGVTYSSQNSFPLPGDSLINSRDIHYLFAWASVFSFSKAIPLKEISIPKNSQKSENNVVNSTSLSAALKVNKVKSPVNKVVKSEFSTTNGFIPLEYSYVNRLIMVPYVSNCGSRILFSNPEWDINNSKRLFKLF